MQTRLTRRRRLRVAAAVLAVVAIGGGIVGVMRGRGAAATPDRPGSTLHQTYVDPRGTGVLHVGPGEPLVDRTDIAPAAAVRRTLVTWAQISDAHMTDEESPLRVEALDRLGGEVSSAFRPQEALTAQVLAAATVSVNALHPALVLITGDLTDNAQRNELALALGVLHGGIVRPDSGAPGYAGVQAESSGDPFLYRPDIDAPRHPGLLAAAQAPFTAPGLEAPWLPLVSNHDLLVQGNVPVDAELSAIATGSRKLVEPSAEAIKAVEEGTLDRGALAELLQGDRAGAYATVPADPARAPYTPAEAVATIARAAGVAPVDGRLVWRRQLAPGVVAIGLDTADRDGGASGILPADELAWLAGQLTASSGQRIVVVSPTPLESTAGGAAALALLDRTPGVVAVLAGDTHRSLVTPRRVAGGGYWLVRTPSLADYPQQARAFRLVELTDGRVALETWLLDQAGRDGAGGYLGLAGTSRDLAYLDPQGGRPKGDLGARLDRNVRLFLP